MTEVTSKMHPIRGSDTRNTPLVFEENDQDHSFDDCLDDCLELFEFSTPLPEKGRSTLRLYYNNCNGIEINRAIHTFIKTRRDKIKYNYIKDIEAPTKIDNIIRQMKVWGVDISCLAELCVAWEDSSPRRVIQQISNVYDNTSCWTVSSSALTVGNNLKPGGTGILTMNEYSGRIKERGTDPWKLGRWSYVLLAGNERSPCLLIITGYRVGKRSGTAGASTAWSQQCTLLHKAGRSEDPHNAFLTDLDQWLSQDKFQNTEILLVLDANEQWQVGSEIREFSRGRNFFNLNEIFQLRPTHPNIIHPSRSTTIDFCLCSEGVLEAITYMGSTPYDLDILGDHRGIILDMDIKQILGKVQNKTNASSRKLVLSNPKAVENYLAAVNEGFDKQNIFERASKLYRRVRSGHTDIANLMRKYDQLDKEVFQICNKSEKKSRPTIAGRHAWSPALAKGIKQLSYWRTRLKHGGESAVVKKLGKDLDLPYLSLPQELIRQKVQDSYQTLKEIQSNAQMHRQNHLSQLAENYARQHNLSLSTAINELLLHEQSRQLFRELKSKLKPIQRSQLKQLWVSIDEQGNYNKDLDTKHTLSDSRKIHEALLARNTEHLTQASNTPFASGDFKRRLKWDGTGKLAEDILSGNILNERKYTSAMQLYLESLQNKKLHQMNVVKPTLSFEEYKNFWKKKRETTVTSPYGLHVGHYKAAILSPKILEVHRVLLLIPFQLGMVPTRWQRTVQTMIEKEPGSPWIHRLRIIELFDAQANAGFQIFVGRKLIHQAVEQKTLRPESYGSTPGKTAASAVLQKILSIDQLRIERRAGGIFDCDASGCYDRILPPLASVHLQALGLDQSIGTFLARFMFLAKRHVRTGEGVSRRSIRTTKQTVLHGIGQGNGGGPAIWLSHLTIMLAAVSAVCSGFFTSCVQLLTKIMTVGTGYVDDVTLALSLPNNIKQTDDTVRRHIKKMSQLWEQLLYISGGRLELSKCFWVPINWKWVNGKPTMKSTRSYRGKQLYLIESETNDEVLIPRVSGREAIKRLGIRTNCAASWAAEYKIWSEFSKSFGTRIRNARLGRIAGYHAYHAMWMSKFRYSAPVIGLTIKQLQQIKRGIVGPSLAASGICSKMPRAVVFGPSEFGGMEWDNPTTVSLYEKLKILIGSIRLQDTVGKILNIQLSWLQIFSGISTPLLEYNKPLDYLPPGWLVHLHSLLVDTNIQVEITGLWTPTAQRIDDKVIMDYVLHHTPSWMWEGINRCRLFLQSNTFADLTTLDGCRIPRKIYVVKGAIRKNNILFPTQLRPSEVDRVYWKYLIDSISIDGRLHSPLGHWLRFPDQQFKYMFAIDTNTVYKRQGQRWQIYSKQKANTRRYCKLRLSVDTVPPQSKPVWVIELSQSLLVPNEVSERNSLHLLPRSVPPTKRDISQKQVLGKYRINHSQMNKLKLHWQTAHTTIVCATDGGLKDKVGTSSYAFFLPREDDPILVGFSTEYQPLLSASSTRQELLGQLAVEYWLLTMRSKWHSPRYRISVVLVTDSQSSIEIIKATDRIIGISDTLSPEMDVALEIKDIQRNNPWIERQIVKVQSHIEKEEAPDEYLWECNKLADQLATEARTFFSPEAISRHQPMLFQGARSGCKIQGRLENNNLYKTIRLSVDGSNLSEYLSNKYGWSQTTFEDIAWNEHFQELNRYPKPMRATLAKYLHGWLANKKRQFRTGSFIDPCCILCGEIESTSHMFTCTNEQFSHLRKCRWEDCLSKFRDITQAGALQVILAGMEQMFTDDDQPETTIREWPNDIQNAYKSQQLIGWAHFLYGRVSKKWTALVDDTAPGTGSQWTRKTIRLFWTYGLDLWTLRNSMVHGSPGEISNLEKEKIDRMVSELYDQFLPRTHSWYKDFFNIPKEERIAQSYKSKKAWLESIRALLPSQFKMLERTVVGNLRFDISSAGTSMHI